MNTMLPQTRPFCTFPHTDAEWRQRLDDCAAVYPAWQRTEQGRANVPVQDTETAYLEAYSAGMCKFNANQPRSACTCDAERDGWDKAAELDCAEFYNGLNSYLDEMAGYDLDYLATVDAAIDRQYARWGMG